MNCTPFVIQYIILSNKWGAVHHENSSYFRFYKPTPKDTISLELYFLYKDHHFSTVIVTVFVALSH